MLKPVLNLFLFGPKKNRRRRVLFFSLVDPHFYDFEEEEKKNENEIASTVFRITVSRSLGCVCVWKHKLTFMFISKIIIRPAVLSNRFFLLIFNLHFQVSLSVLDTEKPKRENEAFISIWNQLAI
jgi:hypothetical protein